MGAPGGRAAEHRQVQPRRQLDPRRQRRQQLPATHPTAGLGGGQRRGQHQPQVAGAAGVVVQRVGEPAVGERGLRRRHLCAEAEQRGLRRPAGALHDGHQLAAALAQRARRQRRAERVEHLVLQRRGHGWRQVLVGYPRQEAGEPGRRARRPGDPCSVHGSLAVSTAAHSTAARIEPALYSRIARARTSLRWRWYGLHKRATRVSYAGSIQA